MNKNSYKRYKRSGTFHRNVKNRCEEYKKLLETVLSGKNNAGKCEPERLHKQPQAEPLLSK